MPAHIHVVLQKDVSNLGNSGDLVRVRPGYARNFLLPRGLAVPATTGNLARIEDLKRVALARAVKERAEAEAVAAKLAGVSVKIVRAVGEGNKMFGSVTPKDIEEAFLAAGMEIDRRRIELAEPIKQLGLAEVSIKLHHDVSAVLRVEVVKA